MNQERPFSWTQRARSFRHAWRGIVILIKEEHNARIHLGFALLAIALGLGLQIAVMEWIAIIICMGLVLAAEALNTALEALCNLVSPEYNELIKKSKDCAAAGVFVTAMASALVGGIIFAPKLYELATAYCSAMP